MLKLGEEDIQNERQLSQFSSVHNRKRIYINGRNAVQRYGISTPATELWFIFLRAGLEKFQVIV